MAIADSSAPGVAPDGDAAAWTLADTLRETMDATEYKSVVIVLILLKHLSDATQDPDTHLVVSVDQNARLDEQDRYEAAATIRMPPEALWDHLQSSVRQDNVTEVLEIAVSALLSYNPGLKGILPTSYDSMKVDHEAIHDLIDALGRISDINTRAIPDHIWDQLCESLVARTTHQGPVRARIRVRPTDVEVPEDNPFRHDLLDRFDDALALTHLLHRFGGPCVVAIDAPWGSGKTTFIKMWCQYLRNHDLPTIEFNAWTDDFSKDPFIALSSEILDALQVESTSHGHAMLKAVVDRTRRAIAATIVGAVKLSTSGLLDLDAVLNSEGVEPYGEARLRVHREVRDSVTELRLSLESAIKSLDFGPLVVVIDELDRCRPSYAIELLEVSKHIFAVDGIVFVLAVNRAQLSNSMKGHYGATFDAESYLSRFFDIDVRLPSPDRDNFITSLIETVGLTDYFERTHDMWRDREAELVPSMLLEFFGTASLSFREVDQAIRRLGLVYASLYSHFRSFSLTATVLTILRALDHRLYGRFVDGDADGNTVLDEVFSRYELHHLRSSTIGEWFQAVIFLSAEERDLARGTPAIDSDLKSASEHAVTPDKDPSMVGVDEDNECAEGVSGKIASLRRKYAAIRQEGVGFRHTVRRLELFSTSFIGHPSINTNDSIYFSHESDATS